MSLNMYFGPADDQSFACSRRVELLRVTRNLATKQWDALDLLDDTPHSNEEVFIYECRRRGYGIFWDGTQNGRRTGGYIADGDYEFVIAVKRGTELDRIVRDREKWRAFIESYFGVTIDWSDGTIMADVVPIQR